MDDSDRIDWLAQDPDRLMDVRAYMRGDGDETTLRQAIDRLARARAPTLPEAGERQAGLDQEDFVIK